MLREIIDHLVWGDWNRKHCGKRWPTHRLAPALIIYGGDWTKISIKLFEELPRERAKLALEIIRKYAKER